MNDGPSNPTTPSAPEGAPTASATASATPPTVAASRQEGPITDGIVAEGERLGVPRGSTRRIWEPNSHRPSYVFLATVAILSFLADIGSKLWAEKRLPHFEDKIDVWKGHIAFIGDVRNKGGAWGLLQTTSENVRKPFFLLVSVAAIAFIVTLYRRLQPRQQALKWGLPLVLGGALGNVFDRVRYGGVVDFIKVHAFWGGIDHEWPTFNVADIAICVGVGLMAVDMFTSKKRARNVFSPAVPPAQAGETSPMFPGVPAAIGSAITKPDDPPAKPVAGDATSPDKGEAKQSE